VRGRSHTSLVHQRLGASPMPDYEICWNRTRLQWARRREQAPWMQEAVLLERVLLAGKPQLRIVTRLGRYVEDRIDDPSEQERLRCGASLASCSGSTTAIAGRSRSKFASACRSRKRRPSHDAATLARAALVRRQLRRRASRCRSTSAERDRIWPLDARRPVAPRRARPFVDAMGNSSAATVRASAA
jgi:hypothetical protein